MKELLLIRHAKSLHDSYVLADAARHLAARGYADAAQTARHIGSLNQFPEVIVSSPAIRAYSTAFLLASALEYPVENIVLKKAVYEASASTLMYLISELPDRYNRVMLVGHNPGFTDVINVLCGPQLSNLPTAACAFVSLPVSSWSSVLPGSGSLVSVYSSHKDIY